MSEADWIINDMKVELFALEVKKLRKSYLDKNPDATNQQVNDYINSKLRSVSDSLLSEQFSIISDAGLIKNRYVGKKKPKILSEGRILKADVGDH